MPPYAWQQLQWQLMARNAADDRLHHAYLLTGPAGTGKSQFADALSHLLLCEKFNPSAATTQPCGSCQRCMLFAAGTHPDLTVIDWLEKSSSISVDQIRTLCAKLALTATYGPSRIAVIRRAQSMTAAAANSLLKTLEEPPAGCLLLLVSDRETALPITVRSRCQRLVMPIPPESQSVAWLQSQGVSNPETSLQSARGAPLLAAALVADGSLASIDALRGEWREFLFGHRDLVLLAEAAAKHLSTRESLGHFSQWSIEMARTVEVTSAAEGKVNVARRRYLAEVCRILSAAMRLDNASLKTQTVIEGALADIRKTRIRIRAEIHQ